MLDLVELKILCDEYDDENGDYPESVREGESLYKFALDRASQSKVDGASANTASLPCSCNAGKRFFRSFDTGNGMAFCPYCGKPRQA
jgi:hypothetical protein